MDGHFGFGVDDGEAFAVHGVVAAENEAASVRAFEFHEEFGVFVFEAVEDVGVDDDDEVAGVFLFGVAEDDGLESALDFDAHGHRVFDATATLAVWAGL